MINIMKCVLYCPLLWSIRQAKKKGPYSNSGKKFGKILKIWKNTLENSENTRKNSEKY